MKLSESSLIRSISSVNRYNARDIADLTFLYCITLHLLRVDWASATFARTYANKTLIHGDWTHEHLNGTDLYQLLHITLTHSNNFIAHLRNKEASQQLLHDIVLSEYDVKRFLRNIASNNYNDDLSERLLLRMEQQLRISITNYKSVRRIASDWNQPHITQQGKELAVTRLLQAMRHRAVTGDLVHALQQFAQREKLEIADACDPETGRHCDPQSAPSKMSMLKKLVVGAGLGLGAFYLGRAIAKGLSK
jgi:hypothetical protein